MKQFTEGDLDFMKELSNVGVGHAATALSQMIGRQVGMRVPNVSIMDISSVPDLMGGSESPVSGVFFEISGDIRGVVLLILSEESSRMLVRLLLNETEEHLTELGRSSLMEVGNILASAYLSVMGNMLGIRMIPSIPFFANDMMGAVVDTVLIRLGSASDLVFVCETEFYDVSEDIKGHLFLLPDPESVTIIMESLKKKK